MNKLLNYLFVNCFNRENVCITYFCYSSLVYSMCHRMQRSRLRILRIKFMDLSTSFCYLYSIVAFFKETLVNIHFDIFLFIQSIQIAQIQFIGTVLSLNCNRIKYTQLWKLNWFILIYTCRSNIFSCSTPNHMKQLQCFFLQSFFFGNSLPISRIWNLI